MYIELQWHVKFKVFNILHNILVFNIASQRLCKCPLQLILLHEILDIVVKTGKYFFPWILVESSEDIRFSA